MTPLFTFLLILAALFILDVLALCVMALVYVWAGRAFKDIEPALPVAIVRVK